MIRGHCHRSRSLSEVKVHWSAVTGQSQGTKVTGQVRGLVGKDHDQGSLVRGQDHWSEVKGLTAQ